MYVYSHVYRKALGRSFNGYNGIAAFEQAKDEFWHEAHTEVIPPHT